MTSHRLTFSHFLLAVTATSIIHAVSFSIVTALFLSVVYSGRLLGEVTFVATCLLYITSYACHELAHYYVAAHLGAQPIVWVDHNSVSVLSNPRIARHGRDIAIAGPLAAVIWIFAWWGVVSFFLPALCFAALIPSSMLASAHLGSLLPGFSDGKALTQYHVTKRRFV